MGDSGQQNLAFGCKLARVSCTWSDIIVVSAIFAARNRTQFKMETRLGTSKDKAKGKTPGRGKTPGGDEQEEQARHAAVKGTKTERPEKGKGKARPQDKVVLVVLKRLSRSLKRPFKSLLKAV